jgi:hypothetical protein
MSVPDSERMRTVTMETTAEATQMHQKHTDRAQLDKWSIFGGKLTFKRGHGNRNPATFQKSAHSPLFKKYRTFGWQKYIYSYKKHLL